MQRSNSVIKEAVHTLKRGGVIIFPTDTVWGIGVSLSNTAAVERLYSIKGREEGKPTAVLVSGMEMAERYGRFSQEARDLANKYWPGGLTVIVPAGEATLPQMLLGQSKTIGLRVPKNDITLSLISRLGEAIAAGSANFSGDIAPREYKDIDKRLLRAVDYVLARKDKLTKSVSFESGGQMPSTVVDATKKPMVVLREGPVRLATD